MIGLRDWRAFEFQLVAEREEMRRTSRIRALRSRSSMERGSSPPAYVKQWIRPRQQRGGINFPWWE